MTFRRDADTALLNARFDLSPVCVKPQKYQFAAFPAPCPVTGIVRHRGCSHVARPSGSGHLRLSLVDRLGHRQICGLLYRTADLSLSALSAGGGVAVGDLPLFLHPVA
ncbi:hypothetical protein AGR7A_Cc60079 [Agrobacterium deltaense NCPPB 1641]|uniref:Uncharacterized protein n=1 Tax=Agrobacterium deltaense NCPPB 1641 TaxID=1183425 RepID=A0A1S7TRR0_9HYPH|nr:hypothetical protein AGR7A_Cc60079 [Agrobacterium deltaense NCPPB 1641]